VKIGLRISVATARGAALAVPRLVELLARYGAAATFYFNLGPDRLHRCLPGGEIGNRAAGAIAMAREAGFEVGVYGWDPVRAAIYVVGIPSPKVPPQLPALRLSTIAFAVSPMVPTRRPVRFAGEYHS
jgi:hypothetical protein